MTDAAVPPAGLFDRASTRHRFTARRVSVADVGAPAEQFVRVTVSGPELADFVSTGPADHMRVYFPHPESGRLVAPTAAGPGEDGIVKPAAPAFARDFTPLHVRRIGGGVVVDIDILQHENPGPAALWAVGAAPGAELVLVGPRGSKGVPQRAPRVLLAVDGTALPAAGRWIAELPETTEVTVVADIDGDLAWVEEYLRAEGGRAVPVRPAGAELAEGVAAAGVDAGTFMFAASEASRLVGLRRYLRELGGARDQFALHGYWKRGQAGPDEA